MCISLVGQDAFIFWSQFRFYCLPNVMPCRITGAFETSAFNPSYQKDGSQISTRLNFSSISKWHGHDDWADKTVKLTEGKKGVFKWSTLPVTLKNVDNQQDNSHQWSIRPVHIYNHQPLCRFVLPCRILKIENWLIDGRTAKTCNNNDHWFKLSHYFLQLLWIEFCPINKSVSSFCLSM